MSSDDGWHIRVQLRPMPARFNIALRPRKPEGSLGRTAQDGHRDSHTAPELWHSLWQSRLDYTSFTTDIPSTGRYESTDREIWRTELNPVIRLTNPKTQLQSSGAPGFSVGRSANRAIPSCPFAERVRTACRWEHNQLQQKTELCGLTTFSLRLWHNIYPVPILCRRKQPAVTKQKHLWNDNGVWYARWYPVSILWRWTPNQS